MLLIAGTPPGGGQDRVARAFAAVIQPLLDVPIEVVNQPGRGGSSAWESLTGTPGDAHRLSISSPTLVTNVLIGASPIDHRDVTPLALLCYEYVAFVVASRSPITSGAELIEWLGRSHPPITALATARGNVNHLALARLGAGAGIDPSSLPIRVFDSARHAIADIVSGDADIAAVSAASAVPEAVDGSLRGLAVTSPRRLPPPFDQIPTWKELSIECTIGIWRGLVAPPGIEATASAFWQAAVAAAVLSASWRNALTEHLWTSTHLTAEATRVFQHKQQEELGGLLRELRLIGG